jgi:hypothetical protein
MAKDPAVLFYTSDFLTGCALMSMAQRGKYITLLCLQHQQGHLSEDDMIDVCGAVDPKIWRKFKQDDDGLFYNERMETECERRKNFVLSKVENGKKGGRPKKKIETDSKPIEKREKTDSFAIAKATEKLLENENINTLINRDIKSIDKSNSNKDKETDIYTFKAPTVEEVAAYCRERRNSVDAERFVSYYTANGWKVGKNNPMVDWRASVRSWENNGIPNETKAAAPELAKSFDINELYKTSLKRTYGG